MDHPEIAVDGAGGVECVGASAGGVERADELLADVRGLADTRDGDSPAAAEHRVGHAVEAIAEPSSNRRHRRGLGFEDAASERDPVERCGRHWHVLVPVRNGKSDRER